MAEPSSVEGYLAALPQAQRAPLEKLRTAIRSLAPDATETISYKMPTFTQHGRLLVSYAAFKDHCSLFPANARVREVCGDALAPYLSGKATLRFAADAPIPDELLRKIVQTRIDENAKLAGR